MKKTSIKFSLAGLALAAATGSGFASPVTKEGAALTVTREAPLSLTYPSYEPIVVQRSGTQAGLFNSGMMFLTEQIERNAHPDSRVRPTVITSFVDLNNLGETSGLGRLMGEHFMHQLQIRGWNVTDIRMTRDLIINEEGEFSLSRELKRLRGTLAAANVVTGTYTATVDGILVSVRVLDLATGQVVSTAQTRFMRDKFINSLVDKPRPAPVVQLTR
jgi:TolB-like protein